jgi:hypothetical protein
VQVEMHIPTVPGHPPMFRIRGVSVITAPERLTVFAHSQEKTDLDAAENTAIKLLELLPHTPMTAVGENVKFRVDESDVLREHFNVDLKLSEIFDFPFDLVKTEIRSSLDIDGRILNFFRERSDSETIVHFNFHYPVKSASEGKNALKSTFIQNYEFACSVLDKIGISTNESLSDDESN